MAIESALFFETTEQIYERVFRTLKPRAALPHISVQFRKFANANSRIRLHGDRLDVEISDLLENAPAPIQESLAFILISKLFRRVPDAAITARYRHYLNLADVRHSISRIKRERGRKQVRHPQGDRYDLRAIFDDLNSKYFDGVLSRPELGWSVRASRSTLGHFDPSHHIIVLSKSLDSERSSELLVRFVMFHEMLHLQHPTEHKGFRRCVHTKEFREAERRFEDYEVAKAELAKFSSLSGS